MAQGSLEAESELRHFLRIARPEWSLPCQGSGSNRINQVIEKLRAIGIFDTETLVSAIETNTINDQLARVGHVRFSRESVDAIKRQLPFIRSLESLDTPNVRQVGQYAYVPQMLSKKRLVKHADKVPSGSQRPAAKRRGCSSGDESLLAATDLRLRGVPPGKTRRSRPLEFPAGAAPQDDDEAPAASGSSVRSLLLASTVPSSVFASASAPAAPRATLPAISATLELPQRSRAAPENLGASASSSMPRLGSASATELGSTLGASLKQRLQTESGRTGSPSTSALPSAEFARQMLREGSAMRMGATEARWSPAFSKAWEVQGEEMLKEQAAMDERDRFVRCVSQDDMRSVVARNIEARLREEELRDSTEGLNITQRCMNIRKHLASMINSRRDVQSLRSRLLAVTTAEMALGPREELSLIHDGFGRAAGGSSY